MYSVEQYIKNGNLPEFGFLSENDYENIFKEVGIPYDKSQGELKDQKLSADALERLQFNTQVNKALMTQKSQQINKNLLSGYENLINEEKTIIKNANGKYDSEVEYMNAIVSELENEKKAHENIVNNFTFSNVNKMLNGLQQVRLEGINEKMEKNDSKLQAEYSKLDTLKQTMKTARTGFKKKRTERRLARVAKRLAKLREKQGKLIGQQRQIINAALSKYVEIKNKEMKEYGKTVANDKKYINKMNDLNSRLEAAREDKRITEEEINNLNTNSGKFARSLQSDKKRLEKEIESLNKKMQRAEQIRAFYQKMNVLRGKLGAINGFGVLGLPFTEQQTQQVSFGR